MVIMVVSWSSAGVDVYGSDGDGTCIVVMVYG